MGVSLTSLDSHLIWRDFKLIYKIHILKVFFLFFNRG